MRDNNSMMQYMCLPVIGIVCQYGGSIQHHGRNNNGMIIYSQLNELRHGMVTTYFPLSNYIYIYIYPLCIHIWLWI